ncbi:Hypothetical protein R9X50_00474900 [Acrodontium crateriforme]|uniref:Uncharacterized protein n=1 Tax=Acrodontium crateriforme TaxID=150365 RepID=A0AAQ3M6R4_9PEZI|nr:Hypothetical protein R9X50_00474900 [Acrodontium crateriforme]
MADANMDIDMDIDIDLSYEDPEIARLQAEAAAIEARAAEAANAEAMNGVEQTEEEGEINLDDPAPTKVHVRGVDNLTTNDIKNFAGEHFSTDLFSGKVQWIDDTSANLIYDTEQAAEEALLALSAEEVTDLQQLRPAKRLSTHPDVELSVRQAKLSDVKEKGAKDRSRFYLMNPEYDPDNRPRRRQGQRGGRRDRGYQRPRRDSDDDRNGRRDSHDEKPFDVNLYDDAPAASNPRPERMDRGDDLFASKQNGRLRNRSASPSRDGDGRYGFNDDQPHRRTARRRSRTPPRRGSDNREARDRLRTELFPGKESKPSALNGKSNGDPIEPRAAKTPSTMDIKELFPDKATSHHKRIDPREVHPNDVTTAIGQWTFNDNNKHERQTYPTAGGRPANGERDLFSRISGGPKGENSYGRLQAPDDRGFSFKGAGDSPGFSILGASKERVENPLVKELFPVKAGKAENNSRDLFDGRIKGKVGQRRRAEDLN